MIYLCWTCGKDRRCTSEEHKYLQPHAHSYPMEINSKIGHLSHKVEYEDWDAERRDAEVR